MPAMTSPASRGGSRLVESRMKMFSAAVSVVSAAVVLFARGSA